MLEVTPAALGAVAHSHIEAFVRQRAGEVSASTVRSDLVRVRQWLRWCVDQGHLARDPSARVRGPKGQSRTRDHRRVVTLAELDRLDLPDGARAMALALWATGLRVGELLAVRPGDVRGDWVHVRSDGEHRTKAGQARDVPVSPEGRSALLVVAESGTMGPRGLRGILARRSAACGVEPAVHPHGLRHSRISLWVADGHPLQTVARWAGHASIRTTERYIHICGHAPVATGTHE